MISHIMYVGWISRYTYIYVRYHYDTITGENATEAVVWTEERLEKIVNTTV